MSIKESTFKVYINKIKENWIVDRLKNEFTHFSDNLTTNYQRKADLIWIIAPWTWKDVSRKHLSSKKVICTIHHIDEDKFNNDSKNEFYQREEYVDLYHVASPKTFDQLKKYTDKKIVYIPFWIDKNKWFHIDNKKQLREQFKISNKDFIIGSFQRDSEGHDTSLPKLSKGPDRFLEIVKHYQNHKSNLAVLLTGKRRNYLLNELTKLEIKNHYFEMVKPDEMNNLYNLLDLYIVSSRVEGGPFSIYESAMTKTPIISTDVGVASEILAGKSIYKIQQFDKAVPDVEFAYKRVQEFTIDKIIPKYIKIMRELHEN